MSQLLSQMHHNKTVILPRITLNLLASTPTITVEQKKIIQKLLDRASKKEMKTNKPCMKVPIRIWELKNFFLILKLVLLFSVKKTSDSKQPSVKPVVVCLPMIYYIYHVIL